MKRVPARVLGIALVTVVAMAGILVLWPPLAFAPTTVEYIAGPLSIDGGQTVRAAFFNATNRDALVTIAILDKDGTLQAGGKEEMVAAGDVNILDFTPQNPLVVICLVQVQRSYGRVLPGATLQAIGGNNAVVTNFVIRDGTS